MRDALSDQLLEGRKRERETLKRINTSVLSVVRDVILILSISKHLLKSKEQADERRGINYSMMNRYKDNLLLFHNYSHSVHYGVSLLTIILLPLMFFIKRIVWMI